MALELEPITLKLEGNVAESHKIDVFQLANTIKGFGKVTGHSLYLLQRLEVAGKGQYVKDLQVLAKPPVSGSVELIYFIEATQHLSPYLFEPFIRHGTELLRRTITSIFLFNSDRESEAMQHAEMTFDYLTSRDLKDERITHHLIERLTQQCQGGCKEAVSSIGKTANLFTMPHHTFNLEIDETDAAKIRLSAEETLGPERPFTCVMDGITEHTNSIMVKVDDLKDEDNYLTAQVKDRLFGQTDNPYITALNTKRPLTLIARPVLKDGRIIRLIVFEAILN